MDEPLSSAGPTWATSTALHCDSLRCERRPDSSQGLKSRYVPQGAKERLISLVLSMERPSGRFSGGGASY